MRFAEALGITPAQFFSLMEDPAKEEFAQDLLDLIQDKKIKEIKKFIKLGKAFFE